MGRGDCLGSNSNEWKCGRIYNGRCAAAMRFFCQITLEICSCFFLNFDFCVSTASWACCDIVAHCLSVRQARRYRISVTNTPRKRMQYCIMLDAVISSVGGMP